ncbi:MAG: ribosomal protein S18-alanine N-acetyltransferase [Clostridiaceae bacterium]|nr:ribosomal protein S18-alanine N-acetyltransferase [Clostridiaceae bacterium]
MPKVNVATAGSEMLPAIATLEARSFAVPWTESELRGTAASPFTVLRIASLDGQIAGYLCASVIFEESEILRIAVLPECRRMGIARALLHHFFDEFPQNATFLEVRASNIPACALYQSEGFTETGLRRNYYEHPTEDAVCMRRESAAPKGIEPNCAF